MAWEASDIAIILTAAATALTSVSSVAIPWWRDYRSEEQQRKERLYERTADSVVFCVENIDRIMEIDRHDMIYMAFGVAGKPTGSLSLSEDDVRLKRDFDSHRRKAEMLLREADIDPLLFLSEIVFIRGTRPSFSVVDDKLQSHDGNSEVLKRQVDAADRLVKSATTVLKEMRSKLGV